MSETKVTSWDEKVKRHHLNHQMADEAYRIKQAAIILMSQLRLAEFLLTYAPETPFEFPDGIHAWGVPIRLHFDISMEPGTWKVQGVFELEPDTKDN